MAQAHAAAWLTDAGRCPRCIWVAAKAPHHVFGQHQQLAAVAVDARQKGGHVFMSKALRAQSLAGTNQPNVEVAAAADVVVDTAIEEIDAPDNNRVAHIG